MIPSWKFGWQALECFDNRNCHMRWMDQRSVQGAEAQCRWSCASSPPAGWEAGGSPAPLESLKSSSWEEQGWRSPNTLAQLLTVLNHTLARERNLSFFSHQNPFFKAKHNYRTYLTVIFIFEYHLERAKMPQIPYSKKERRKGGREEKKEEEKEKRRKRK